MLDHQGTATDYRRFAVSAADSPCFSSWAAEIAADEQVLAWLEDLPEPKRQPNLVFAAARWHGVAAPGPYANLRAALLLDDGAIRGTILRRSTQTNEVGRLATLVSAFGLLASDSTPLALVEVGASAGLCLYPDRYDYDFGPAGALRGSGGPVLSCAVRGEVPVPARHPRIGRRVGVDLNPLDVNDLDATAWLENLVWPEQRERRERLRSALEVARADPPELLAGDLLERLPEALERAAPYGTPVVFHSAVIAYLDLPQRRRFAELMTSLVASGACHWISNESKRVLPEVTATGPAVPAEEETFVLGLDGQALAWTHGHGASMRWLGSPGLNSS